MVAVVPVKAKGYVVSVAIAVLNVTVCTNSPPSNTVAFPTLTVAGGVLSVMVAVPVAVPMVAPLPLTELIVAVNVSFGSPGNASVSVGTVKFAVV